MSAPGVVRLVFGARLVRFLARLLVAVAFTFFALFPFAFTFFASAFPSRQVRIFLGKSLKVIPQLICLLGFSSSLNSFLRIVTFADIIMRLLHATIKILKQNPKGLIQTHRLDPKRPQARQGLIEFFFVKFQLFHLKLSIIRQATIVFFESLTHILLFIFQLFTGDLGVLW